MHVDWILLAVVVFYFIIGAYKGFVETLFSFVGIFVAIVVAYKLSEYLTPVLKNITLFNEIEHGLQSFLDHEIEGKFDNIQQLTLALFNTKYGKIFGVFIGFLGKNIVVDKRMTAGEILSPTLTNLICKIIAFIILLIGILVVLTMIRLVLKGFIKISHLKVKNHVAGGLLGAIKGLVVFCVIYVVIVSIANFSLSEPLLAFATSGPISNKIYDLLITKIIGLFY